MNLEDFKQCRFCPGCGEPLDIDSKPLYCETCSAERSAAIRATQGRISDLDLSDAVEPRTFIREEELAIFYGKAARAALPALYRRGFEWEGFSRHPGRVKAGKEWAAAFKRGAQGAYLNGVVGCGKTGLACSIGLEVGRRGFRVGFQNIPILFRDLKGTWSYRDRSENDVWENLLSYNLLILDDLGAETVSESNIENLYLLFDRAARELSPTIIVTSNRPLAALKDFYGPGNGERLASRIGQMTKHFGTFPKEDLRAKK